MHTFSARFAVLGSVAISPVALGAMGGPRISIESIKRVRLFAESTEVRLAREAAPPSISGQADIYVFQGGAFRRAVTGSNGFACMVGRDTRAPSLFPMCFDSAGARTLMPREMMKVELMAAGVPLDSVIPKVNAAARDGRLHYPTTTSLTYMMSAHQVLYDGEKNIGAANPHVMIYLPGTTAAQFSVLPRGISLDDIDNVPLLIVNLPTWSDQRPVSP